MTLAIILCAVALGLFIANLFLIRGLQRELRAQAKVVAVEALCERTIAYYKGRDDLTDTQKTAWHDAALILAELRSS